MQNENSSNSEVLDALLERAESDNTLNWDVCCRFGTDENENEAQN